MNFANMINRTHRRIDADCLAIYSDCEAYRYLLQIVWDESAPMAMFVMLNPSTATELANDPTVERCEIRARRADFGGVCIGNIFAYRATDPRELQRVADPIGAGNDAIIARHAGLAGAVICAWGNHGVLLGRGEAVHAMLRGQVGALWHLGLNKSGQPKHPLYISYAQGFISY